MKLKKLLVTGLILSSVIMSNVFAEDADHSKLFPDFSKGFEFDMNNLYVGAEIPLAFPVGFLGNKKIAGGGSGFALEAGYDWDGWLAGIHFEWRSNKDNGNMMKSLKNTFFTIEVSKLFGNEILPFMPDFLDLRATAGIGIDAINAVYYPTDLYKKNNVAIAGKSAAMVTNLGVEVEYNKIDKVIPYAGLDFNFAGDKGGMFVHTSLNVGARTTLRRIKGPKPQEK